MNTITTVVMTDLLPSTLPPPSTQMPTTLHPPSTQVPMIDVSPTTMLPPVTQTPTSTPIHLLMVRTYSMSTLTTLILHNGDNIAKLPNSSMCVLDISETSLSNH